MTEGASFANKEKNNGPSGLPWGTPAFLAAGVDVLLLSAMTCERSDKYELTQLHAESESPISFSLATRRHVDEIEGSRVIHGSSYSSTMAALATCLCICATNSGAHSRACVYVCASVLCVFHIYIYSYLYFLLYLFHSLLYSGPNFTFIVFLS